MKNRIYLASSWRNEFQPGLVKELRENGFLVYDFRNPIAGNKGFAWSSIDPNWEHWTTAEYRRALNHIVAKRGFKLDFDAMKWANICVLLLPCGRSAHIEAGWMKGAGKKVFAFIPFKHEPELMYKLFNGVTDSVDELLQLIKR